ncbi:hypothetical protein CI109_101915 [Kwoniella shandongensis]|uniref:Uncharacterized protein n=1 Tax=Kwoniella shandongensis TaxID=1734106 RepID=A0A5M6BVM4_9TREE|nr:uncharacterized protein CI109_005425 [Kwoniella shandongensis]KAA5526301.1 hypothetical protein CI109_005425 [Kwoniella shandongensis]
MPFWKKRDDRPGSASSSSSQKRPKGHKSIYATAPAIQERESSLYLPTIAIPANRSSGRRGNSRRGSGLDQATVQSSPQRGINNTSAKKPNRTLFTTLPDHIFNNHPQQEVVRVTQHHNHQSFPYYTNQQLQQHPYDRHPHSHSTSYSLSTFDLDCRAYSSKAYNSSTVDIRRPRSISFADDPIWTDESRSSSSYYNHSYDSEDEDDDEAEEKHHPAHQKRANLVTKARLTCQSLLELGKTMSGALGLKGEGMKSEVWGKSHATDDADSMAAPPPIPARSRLRTVPEPKSNTSPYPTPAHTPSLDSSSTLSLFPTPPTTLGHAEAPARVVGHKKSEIFQLPVDPPLPLEEYRTPVLPSSPVAGTLESPSGPNRSPGSNGDSILTFGKKKSGKVVEKDPHKVRDGAEKKASSSGVYTPMTFPGASGPRPSHFPTHVYTPPTFTLHPTKPQPQPISPSGSSIHSSSSSHSDSTAPPATPLSPTTRFSKALSNVKRFSTNIKGQKDSQHPHAHDYFIPASISLESNSTANHSRDSSLGPQTPTSSYQPHTPVGGYFPPISAGLGMGLPEDVGSQGSRTRAQSTSATTVLFDHGVESGKSPMQSPSLGHKGRRKPVPRLADDGLVNGMAKLEVEQTHAL